MKITLNDYVLAGGQAAHEEPTHLSIRGRRQVALLQKIRAEAVEAVNRGNLKLELRFQVGRRHPSAKAAGDHLLRHASQLTQAGGTLTIDLEDAQHTTYHLDHAALEAVDIEGQGNASYTTYTIIGGLLHV